MLLYRTAKLLCFVVRYISLVGINEITSGVSEKPLLRIRLLFLKLGYCMKFQLRKIILVCVFVVLELLDNSYSQMPSQQSYPKFTAYEIKGLQPDFWAKKSDVTDRAKIKNVGINLEWDLWEKKVKLAPCESFEQEYDNRCYEIDKKADDEVRSYSENGAIVTGILYGVPKWARVGNVNC